MLFYILVLVTATSSERYESIQGTYMSQGDCLTALGREHVHVPASSSAPAERPAVYLECRSAKMLPETSK
jgi:hypothetical protein